MSGEQFKNNLLVEVLLVSSSYDYEVDNDELIEKIRFW